MDLDARHPGIEGSRVKGGSPILGHHPCLYTAAITDPDPALLDAPHPGIEASRVDINRPTLVSPVPARPIRDPRGRHCHHESGSRPAGIWMAPIRTSRVVKAPPSIYPSKLCVAKIFAPKIWREILVAELVFPEWERFRTKHLARNCCLILASSLDFPQARAFASP